MASNAFGVEPMQKASRWNKVQNERVDVDCPHSVQMYNRSMGGTDRMDQNIRRLRVSIRSKKWWWPLFTWGLTVTLQNCWLLYRRKKQNVKFLDFAREVAQSLLYKNRCVQYYPRRYQQERLTTDEVRFDMGLPHLVDQEETNIKRRCKVCKLKTTYICITCVAHLHPSRCFRQYHTR